MEAAPAADPMGAIQLPSRTTLTMSSSSKLSATAKPWSGGSSFAFNPAAKTFVMKETPMPPTPKRKTYTVEELYALEQPLYAGSSTLIVFTDEDFADVMLFDPCFDYIGAGLIQAVTVDEAVGGLMMPEDMTGESYDTVMPVGSNAFSQTKRASPKKSKTHKHKHSDSHLSPAKDAAASLGSHSPVIPLETSGSVPLTDIEEGAQQMNAAECSDAETEEAEDSEEDSDDSDQSENGEDDELQEGEAEGQQPYLPVHQQRIQYVWVPQAYGFVPEDGSSFMPDQSFYYASTSGVQPYYASASAYNHDSSFHPGRRRNFGNGSRSPPRRDFSHQDHADHSQSGAGFWTRSGQDVRSGFNAPDPFHPRDPNKPLVQYDRETLLQLRLEPASQERPSNLPGYLSDIYKTASTSASSRSLFGNTTSPTSDSAPTSSSSRSVFNSLLLQPNTNHGVLASESSLGGMSDGIPPKKGGKLKNKRKKNKDRANRAIEDEEVPATRSNLGRKRLDSIGGDEEERKGGEDHHLSAPYGAKRGLSTPKVKPHKQKGGKKGNKKNGRSLESSPTKRSGFGNHHGGASGQSLSNFSLDAFANATMDDLHHSSNRWVPSVASLAMSAEDSLLQIEKSARAILNKLSIDKLPSLLNSMLALPIDEAPSLEVIVNVLFDKSVDEPPFAGLYARFARDISSRLPEFTVHTGAGAAGAEGATSKTYSFRTLLLTRCYRLLVEDEESLRQSMYSNALAAARLKDELNGFSLSGSASNSPRLVGFGLQPPSGERRARTPPRSGSPSRSPLRTQSPLRAHSPLRTSSPLRTHSPVRTASPHTRSPLRTASPRTYSPRLLSKTTSPLIGASDSPLELPLVTRLEFEEKLRLLRVHQRGNLIFIGELFKVNMLPHSVVHLCIDALLDDNTGEGDDDDEPSECDVEAVCTFLACVGRKLEGLPNPDEEEDDGLSKDEARTLRQTRKKLLDGHFSKIDSLSRCRSLQSRFRFMCQDLIELRCRGWVPRIQKVVDPKSLAEMRETTSATPMAPTGYGKSYAGAWQGAPATTVKKQPQAAGKFGGMATHAAVGSKTSFKSMRPAGSSSFQGRTLQFGHSPLMSRSESAPGKEDPAPAHSAHVRTPFSPLPPLHGITPPADGRYVPLWKRRLLGMEEQASGLKPRSVVHPNASDARSGAIPFTLEEGVVEAASASSTQPDDNALSLPVPAVEAPLPTSSPSLSEDELIHQLTVLVDELYSAHDLQEAMQCLEEIQPHATSAESMQSALVSLLFSKGVEQAQSSSRSLCPALLHQLCEQHRMTISALQAGITAWLTQLGDVALDVPKAPSYTAAAIATIIRQGHLTVPHLVTAITGVVDSGVVTLDDAQSWCIDTLRHMRLQSDDDPTAGQPASHTSSVSEVDVSAASASSPSAMVGLAALYSGDRQSAQQALITHKLDNMERFI